MACPACGTATPDGARFCPQCGQALVARPDERRLATVLFADLVGFTTFSEAADPEHVKNLVDTCFQQLAADVVAFGGQVDKFVGDAIVALFGAPVAHEDDPERAVRAALAMQETLARLRAEYGIDVEMRIGVNTGEVLVGALRAGGDYTAMGDVVNTASRIQTAAAPGQVLVGGPTLDATADAIRYEGRRPLLVKGRDAPVDVAIAVEAAQRPGHRRRTFSTPLIGRDAELALLNQAFAAAVQRRRSQCLLVLGEPGVGKSRVVISAALAAQADHDAIVFGGQCLPYGDASIWSPIVDAVRGACHIEDDDTGTSEARVLAITAVAETLGLPTDDDEVVRVATGLLQIAGFAGVAPHADPARVHEESVRSLLELLEGLARRAPVLFVLSDLQWADPALLDTINRAFVRLRELPFAVLASGRTDEASEQTLSDLGSGFDITRVRLDPLDAASTAALASALLESPVEPAFAALLHERSGGNPLFVEELVALWRDETAAIPSRPAAVDTDAERLRRLPSTLHGLVSARLDALPVEARTVLEAAAIVGSTGPIAAVRPLAPPPIDANAMLQSLVNRDLLLIEGDDYRFKSDVIREVAYGTLTKGERARRHATIGAWIAASPSGDADEDTMRRAHHVATAAELITELGPVPGLDATLPTQAVTLLATVAETAARADRYNVAQRHLDRALALGPDESKLRGLLLQRARACANLHALARARDDADRALALAREAGDAHTHAEALSTIADIQQRAGDLADSDATYERALEEWRALDDIRGIAGALRGRGMTHMFAGRLDDAEAVASEALTLFRSIANRSGEAWALQNLAWISFLRNDTDVADARLARATAAFTDAGDWGGRSWADGLLAWVRMQQGRFAEAEAIGTRSLEDAADSGAAWSEGIMTTLLGVTALWTGRTDRAIDYGLRARALFDGIGDTYGRMQATMPFARGYLMRGQFADAFAALEDAREIASTLTDESMRMLPWICAAQFAIEMGDTHGTARTLDELSERVDHVYGAVGDQNLAVGLGRLQAGDGDGALELLTTSWANATTDALRAAIGGPAALALTTAGRTDEAGAVIEAARAPEVGSFLDALQLAWAGALLAARLGDATTALDEVERSVAIADASDSLLDQAVTRQCVAAAKAALGASDAEAARLEADDRYRRLHLTTNGWQTAFAAAVGTVPTIGASESVAG